MTTPKEHYQMAIELLKRREETEAQVHATLGVLSALIDFRETFQTCGHGTVGFCLDCVRLMLQDVNYRR
jgi:hypothetical protein